MQLQAHQGHNGPGGSFSSSSHRSTFNMHTSGVNFLFKSWRADTQTNFALSCAVVFLLAACSELSRHFMARLRRRGPLANAAATFVSYSLSYSLMLLAMTFNYFVFFSIVGGYAFGAYVASSSAHSSLRLSSYRASGPADANELY